MKLDEIRKQAQSYYNYADNSKIIMHNVSNKITLNSGNWKFLKNLQKMLDK